MLTKTNFLRYRDAPMHLWAEKNGQIEVDPTTYQRYLFDQGEEIGNLAKAFLKETIRSRDAKLEVTIEHDFRDGHFEARADVMVFDPQEQIYDLYEIKSATSVKPENLYDVTFQRLVCQASIQIRNVYIVHVNKEYVRQGELDFDQFFIIEDVTDEVDQLKDEVYGARGDAWEVTTSVSPHEIMTCTKPSECPCPGLCHPDLPKYPIYDLPRLSEVKARELRAEGILAIEDIPDDYSLSERQKKQVGAVKAGKAFIDINAIKSELAKLQFPLHFLDYETYNPGIPNYDGYKPYQNMVFQYSLHVYEPPHSEVAHYECLVTEPNDPGIRLVEHLSKHIGEKGSVVVWNKTFEAERNKEMAELYPDYRGILLNINERIFDLMEIFKQGHYIHPDFHGSYSIKKVLPVLVTDHDLSYDDLPIPKGEEAMMAWLGIMRGILSEEEVVTTKQELLRYCELDTMALVKNWKALENLVAETG
jgi:hypothetical protein